MRIPLTQGKFAEVDDKVYESILAPHKPKWYAQYNSHTQSWYARTNITVNCKSRGILMHRMIMKAEKGEIVDHVNHDTLDNRIVNLRICTGAQNARNRRLNSGSQTGFKGVYARGAKFRCILTIGSKRINIGTFPDKLSAALSYNEEALKHHGEFAHLNVIP